MSMQFSADEWLRYSRHIQLPNFGVAAQTKLKQAHVLIVGCGGLGAPVSQYLAAAGVGHLTLIDNDTIELSNLQRQILFSENDIGKAKVNITKERLLTLNSHIDIFALQDNLSIANADNLIQAADIVIDCTDNFATRYVINDTCLIQKKPWLFASVHQYDGQCALFIPEGACFRCLFPDMPENVEDCNTAGVLGVLPGLLGLLQANEAIRYLAHQESSLANQLMLVETTPLNFRNIALRKNSECACCDNVTKTQTKNNNNEINCAVEPSPLVIDHQQFAAAYQSNDIEILDVRSLAEREAFHIGGQHIALDNLAEQQTNLNLSIRYYCYCQTGKRSEAAAKILEDKGYNAKSLQGGLNEYLKSHSNILNV